jgi:hypothetical protein
VSKHHLPLLFILVGHFVLGIAFGLATPIFEAPDEDGHYLFVRYLQIHRALPVQTLDRNGPRAHHPPLYHLITAWLSSWVPVDGSADRIKMEVNPHVWFWYDDTETDNKAMWVHYGLEERWPFRGQALVVHIGRWVSLSFSLLAVWLTYLAARQLRPTDDAFAFLAAGLLAFNPMVLFMSGVLQNNTTLLASGAAVVCLLGVFMLQENGFTWRRWLLIGIVLSLGILLQLGALTLAAPIALVLLYETLHTKRLRTLVEGGLALGIPLALLTGWWFVRNRLLYGDWTGNKIVAEMWCCDSIPRWQALSLFLTGLLGRFGQGLMITYPRGVYVVAALMALFALCGLAMSLFVNLSGRNLFPTNAGRPQGSPQRVRLSPEFEVGSLHAVTGVGVAAALLFYAATVAPGLPGRYMFPAFPSLALLLAAGLRAWFRARWHSWIWIAGAVVALNLGAALYALLGMVTPTYAMPRSPTQAELRQMTPLDAEIGGAAHVLGYRLSAETVRAGETLVVTVYWQVEARTEIPYTIFIHLYTPSVGSITQRDTYPGSGNYATTVWDAGRIFVDTYRLHLPPDAPPVNGAEILLGLYDEKTMQRLPVVGADAGTAEEAWVEFGSIQVKP